MKPIMKAYWNGEEGVLKWDEKALDDLSITAQLDFLSDIMVSLIGRQKNAKKVKK